MMDAPFNRPSFFPNLTDFQVPEIEPNSGPSVFLSFSSKDAPLPYEILACLKQQGFKTWDYSERDEEIPAGAVLEDAIKEKIDCADWFVAFLTTKSMEEAAGLYTRLEFAYAVEKEFHARQRLIPIFHSVQLGESILAPFDILFKDRATRYIELEGKGLREFLRKFELLCASLGQKYRPAFPMHSRLPFWEKFRDEIMAIMHTGADYSALLAIIGEFNIRYAEEKWSEAQFLIGHFLASAEFRFPGQAFPYALLIKGICELHLQEIEMATRTFRECLKLDPENHNAFGGLGQAAMLDGRYADAVNAFSDALKYCPTTDNFDERFNLSAAMVWAGDSKNPEIESNLFDSRAEKLSQEDGSKILSVRGAFLHMQGRNEDAVAIFEEWRKLIRSQDLLPSRLAPAVHYHYNALISLKLPKDAEELLNQAIDFSASKLTGSPPQVQIANSDLIHLQTLKGDFLFGQNRLGEAKKIYASLWQKGKRSRSLAVNLARVERRIAGPAAMRKFLEDLDKDNVFSLPATAVDFYYEGFLHFLKGKPVWADLDFHRSRQGGVRSPEYSRLEDLP